MRTTKALREDGETRAAKYVGREVVRNGTKQRGRVINAWAKDDGSIGLYVEFDVPTMLATGLRLAHGDSEHWTIRHDR